jgi:hypothetical protein
MPKGDSFKIIHVRAKEIWKRGRESYQSAIQRATAELIKEGKLKPNAKNKEA